MHPLNSEVVGLDAFRRKVKSPEVVHSDAQYINMQQEWTFEYATEKMFFMNRLVLDPVTVMKEFLSKLDELEEAMCTVFDSVATLLHSQCGKSETQAARGNKGDQKYLQRQSPETIFSLGFFEFTFKVEMLLLILITASCYANGHSTLMRV